MRRRELEELKGLIEFEILMKYGYRKGMRLIRRSRRENE